ncbi:MAG: acyl-CoA thioesterase [Sulfuritalea sp.]|nr:acyl-CoA thioesterase [Sulfuritalea sp.]
MPRTHTSSFRIEFGDCDPAQIVFYPNFFKWMDIAALHFFNACGIPSWRETKAERGIIGAPLINASAKFVSSATYPEPIEVDTSVAEIRGKSFVLRHVIRRGDTVLVEGEEIRIFAIEDPADPKRIKAVPIPEDILAQWV